MVKPVLMSALTAAGACGLAFYWWARSKSPPPQNAQSPQFIPITLARTTNREWKFKSRPAETQSFSPDDCFELVDCPVPSCGDGQILIAPYLCSVDPTLFNALRGAEAADRTEGSTYYAFMNWELGKVPNWVMVAQVLESSVPEFSPGQLIGGMAPWREVSAVDPAGFTPLSADPQAHLSVLGLTGQTAYLGVKHVIRPVAGNVAYVSGAAGATGLAACQTLKNLGCRVIGSAGSDHKVALLESVGVEAINYKTETILNGLKRLAPAGIDCAFDNVGGETLEAILEMINEAGSIALCGAISQYDTKPSEKFGLKNTFHMVAKRVRMEGFIQFQFSPEQFAECKATCEQWVEQGTLKPLCTVVEGFDKLIAEGLGGLLKGTNQGKLLVKAEL